MASTLGQLQGVIAKNGAPVFGAMIVAEDAHGNVVAGTISRPNGRYELPAMPPGDYRIRVSPIDPSLADDSVSLLRGWEIAQDYDAVETSFLVTTNKAVPLKPGATSTLDVPVAPGEPLFRIAAISRPSDHPDGVTRERTGGFVRPGQNDVWIGVVSRSLPTEALSMTGDGVTVGPTANRTASSTGVM